VAQRTMCSKAHPAIGPVQGRVGPPQADPALRSALRSQPAAPWMEDVALEVWVDVEHSPILVRLSGTLDQSTAINVVPVVKELMADEGRDVELHTPDLEVLDAGGTEALVELQRLVQHSGGHFTWGGTLSELSVSDRSL
jgi:ABC-type transporter Mla MlaB component